MHIGRVCTFKQIFSSSSSRGSPHACLRVLFALALALPAISVGKRGVKSSGTVT